MLPGESHSSQTCQPPPTESQSVNVSPGGPLPSPHTHSRPSHGAVVAVKQTLISLPFFRTLCLEHTLWGSLLSLALSPVFSTTPGREQAGACQGCQLPGSDWSGHHSGRCSHSSKYSPNLELGIESIGMEERGTFVRINVNSIAERGYDVTAAIVKQTERFGAGVRGATPY